MVQDREKIIERVKKLLALSQSPNEHEAALAADRAAMVLQEHNLTLADVTGEDKPKYGRSSVITNSLPWRRPLARAVANLYFCEHYYEFDYKFVDTRPDGYIRSDVHWFVGEKHNITIAKIMFTYLVDAVENNAKRGAAKLATKQRSRYLTSFRVACSLRLQARLREKLAAARAGQAKSETGTTLPALADLYKQTAIALAGALEQIGGMKSSKSRVTISDTRGAMEGRAAGDRIGLDAQISGRDTTHLLGN